MRLPGTLVALAGAAAIGWLTSTMFGATIGAWAALCYATMLLPFVVSLAPLHDLVMVPLVTVAIGAFWQARHTTSLGALARWTGIAGVALGLSVLGKGLTGVGLVGVGVAVVAGVDAGAVVAAGGRRRGRGRHRCGDRLAVVRRDGARRARLSPLLLHRAARRAASPTTRSGTPAARSRTTCRSCSAARGRGSFLLRRRAAPLDDGERLLWAGWRRTCCCSAWPGRSSPPTCCRRCRQSPPCAPCVRCSRRPPATRRAAGRRSPSAPPSPR